METSNLVILKSNKDLIIDNGTDDKIKAFTFYRCAIFNETKKIEYVVNGILFSKQQFDLLFEDAQTKVLRDFKAIGILGEDNKPISKSLFTKLADNHEYGYGRNKFNVWYFRNSRECIYGFYPMQESKIEQQKECYQYYLDLINGEVDSLDNQDVCFGNCGIPLIYKKLRVSENY